MGYGILDIGFLMVEFGNEIILRRHFLCCNTIYPAVGAWWCQAHIENNLDFGIRDAGCGLNRG